MMSSHKQLCNTQPLPQQPAPQSMACLQTQLACTGKTATNHTISATLATNAVHHIISAQHGKDPSCDGLSNDCFWPPEPGLWMLHGRFRLGTRVHPGALLNHFRSLTARSHHVSREHPETHGNQKQASKLLLSLVLQFRVMLGQNRNPCPHGCAQDLSCAGAIDKDGNLFRHPNNDFIARPSPCPN